MAWLVVPDVYPTIVNAYNNALDGDFIYIKESGSPYFEGGLWIKKEIHFIGESTNVLIYHSGMLFIGDHDDIEFETLSMSSPSRCISISGHDNFYLHDCKLTRTGGYSGNIVNCSWMENLMVENNDFYGVTNNPLYLYHNEFNVKAIGNVFYGTARGQGISITCTHTTMNYEFINNTIYDFGDTNVHGVGINVAGPCSNPNSGLIKGNIIIGALKGYAGSRWGILATIGNAEITENYVTGEFRFQPIRVTSDNNIVHFNDFTGGLVSNGKDDGSGNVWSKDNKGNYWGYGGPNYDSNCDFIGDNPYPLDGVAGTYDNYPLMCSIGIWPSCPYTCGIGTSGLPIFAKMLI